VKRLEAEVKRLKGDKKAANVLLKREQNAHKSTAFDLNRDISALKAACEREIATLKASMEKAQVHIPHS
jgi:hypothetical protein